MPAGRTGSIGHSVTHPTDLFLQRIGQETARPTPVPPLANGGKVRTTKAHALLRALLDCDDPAASRAAMDAAMANPVSAAYVRALVASVTMKSADGEYIDAPDLDMRLKAAEKLFDRVMGKPIQMQVHEAGESASSIVSLARSAAQLLEGATDTPERRAMRAASSEPGPNKISPIVTEHTRSLAIPATPKEHPEHG